MNRLKKYAYAAAKNIAAHGWLNVAFTICLVAFAFIISLFVVIACSLFATQEGMKREEVSSNYILSYEEIDCAAEDKIELWWLNMSAFTAEDLGTELDYLPSDYVQILFGEKSYSADGEYSLNIYTGQSLFTRNDYREAEYRLGTTELLYGSMPAAENEICISELLLEEYGLSAEQVLGQKITLTVKINSTVLFDDVTVCGVIAAEYYSLNGHGGIETPTVITSPNNALFTEYGYYKVWIYSFADWLTESEVEYYTENYVCEYVGSGAYEDIALISDLQTVTLKLLAVIVTFICVGTLFCAFLLADKYIRLFARSGGILKAHGFNSKQLNILLLVQVAVVGIVALVLAAALTAAGYVAISALISEFVYIKLISLAAWHYILIFAGAAIFTAAVVALFLLCGMSRIKKRTVRDLLQTKVY